MNDAKTIIKHWCAACGMPEPSDAECRALEVALAQPSGNAGELERECADLAHQLNQSNERNGLLREALQECSAELFAQCGDQKRAMLYVEKARAALAAQASGQDDAHLRERIAELLATNRRQQVQIKTLEARISGRTRDADMYWDADDPERFGATDLHGAVECMMDDYTVADLPMDLDLQCARSMPNVQVRVTGYTDADGWQYEVIPVATRIVLDGQSERGA